MKSLNAIPLLILLMVFSNCRSTRNIEYEIFEGLREEDKAFIIASVESGKDLFKIHCSDCHGIFSRGSDDATNFSREALHDYKQSFLAQDEENHAVIDQLTEGEMQNILLFLTFLKRD